MDDSPVTPFRSFSRKCRENAQHSDSSIEQLQHETLSPPMESMRTRGVPTPYRQRVMKKSNACHRVYKETKRRKRSDSSSSPRKELSSHPNDHTDQHVNGSPKEGSKSLEDRENKSPSAVTKQLTSIPIKQAEDCHQQETAFNKDNINRLSEIMELRFTEPEEQLRKFQQDAMERMRVGNELVLHLKEQLSEARACMDDLRAERNGLRAEVTSLAGAHEEDKRRITRLQSEQQSLMADRRQLQAEPENQFSAAAARTESQECHTADSVQEACQEGNNDIRKELLECRHVIDCYTMLTGCKVAFGTENNEERHFECHFTEGVKMEGHGFSLIHHPKNGEVEYSPLIQQECTSTKDKAKNRRRSVGRKKLTSLPDYLREDIFFDDKHGAPHFTMLMLQSLKSKGFHNTSFTPISSSK